MNVNEKIRVLREVNQSSQEEMAEKMNMSVNGYARIERGETNLNLHKLQKIAKVFNIDLLELISSNKNGIIFLSGEHKENHHGDNHYYGDNELKSEIGKLELIISHKNELLAQKNEEIKQLKEIIELLKLKVS